jgi:hypothetical protein
LSDSLSRRQVSAILFATADAKAALLDFFRRALPGVAIDTQSANACVDSFMIRRSTMKRHALNTSWKTAGVELMAGLNEKFESASCQQAAECSVRNPFANLDPP